MLEGYKLSVYRKVKFGPVARKYRERAKELGLISDGNEWLGTIREKALFLFLLNSNLKTNSGETIPWAELMCLFTTPDGYTHKDLLRDSRDVAREWWYIGDLEDNQIRDLFPVVYSVFD